MKRIESIGSTLMKYTWLQYVLLFLVIVIAAGLRFYKLGEWSMWIDEIYTINRALIHFSNPSQVILRLPETLWLPISVILANIAMTQLGVSEFSARLVSTLIGIASIPILYYVIRKLFGISVAIIFVILLAVSPWHLFWSQNARFYTSLLLLYTLAAFFFFYAIEKDRPAYLFGFYVLFYFSLSERLFAAYLLPTVFLYVFFLIIFRFERPPGFRYRNFVIIIAPLLLIFVYEVVRFARTGDSLTLNFFNVFANRQIDDPFRLLISILYNISFPIFSLGLVSSTFLILKKNRAGLFLFVSAIVPIILLLLSNPFLFTKDRYVFVTLSFWLILAALAIKELIFQTKGLGKLLALGLLIILLADAAGSNVLYYLVNDGNRRDWRAAFQIIEEKSQSNDVVVAFWPEFSPFYLGREIRPYNDVTVDEVLESEKPYWFLIDSETVWNNMPLRYWLINNAQLIDILYLRLPEDDFNLKIYYYDPALHYSNH